MSRLGSIAAGAGRIGLAPVRLARRAGRAGARRPRSTLAILVVVVMLLGGATAMLWREQHRDHVLDRARAAAVETAQTRAAALLSYDFTSVDGMAGRVGDGLTGSFRKDYATLMKEVVAPAAKRQKITTRAEVTAASVVSAEPDRVVCLLFINQTTKGAAQQAPRLSGSRVRVTLERVEDRWLVSELTPV